MFLWLTNYERLTVNGLESTRLPSNKKATIHNSALSVGCKNVIVYFSYKDSPPTHTHTHTHTFSNLIFQGKVLYLFESVPHL